MLRRVGLLLGAVLFAWVLWRADLPAVWQQMRALHWRFALVFLFYGAIFGLDTYGWKFALSRASRSRLRWDSLFRARLAGEALNYVTPSASIGGEPVKAYLLSKRHGVPIADGMASVVIAKTTFSVSMLLFAATGLLLALATEPIPADVARWVKVVLPVLAVLLALFCAVQFVQPFARSAEFLRRFAPKLFAKFGQKLGDWDRSITDLYRDSPAAVGWSFAFHLLGWIAGAFEVWFIMHLLGLPVSLATAWTIEALWVLLRSGAFLIPGSLGASEGFLMMICFGMGISAVSGLAVALIRRAREVLWMALGLVEFSRG